MKAEKRTSHTAGRRCDTCHTFRAKTTAPSQPPAISVQRASPITRKNPRRLALQADATRVTGWSKVFGRAHFSSRVGRLYKPMRHVSHFWGENRRGCPTSRKRFLFTLSHTGERSHYTALHRHATRVTGGSKGVERSHFSRRVGQRYKPMRHVSQSSLQGHGPPVRRARPHPLFKKKAPCRNLHHSAQAHEIRRRSSRLGRVGYS